MVWPVIMFNYSQTFVKHTDDKVRNMLKPSSPDLHTKVFGTDTARSHGTILANKLL